MNFAGATVRVHSAKRCIFLAIFCWYHRLHRTKNREFTEIVLAPIISFTVNWRLPRSCKFMRKHFTCSARLRCFIFLVTECSFISCGEHAICIDFSSLAIILQFFATIVLLAEFICKFLIQNFAVCKRKQ